MHKDWLGMRGCVSIPAFRFLPILVFVCDHVSLHIYKNKLPMKILYYIYQICIALPILLVLTILTAIVTIVGSLLGGAHFWGYYPGKIWSQLICLFLLIPVKIHDYW